MLTQEKLKSLVEYDPTTGIFKWIVNIGGMKIGWIAGSTATRGYRQIRIERRLYLSHRLAWLYTYGYFPESGLDHINGITHDNRLINLREASQLCNMRNTGNYQNNTSGVKGVSFNKRARLWKAEIRIKDNKIYLGSHKEFIEAVCHRLAAEQAVGWSNCDSSSPAYQYVKKHIQDIK